MRKKYLTIRDKNVQKWDKVKNYCIKCWNEFTTLTKDECDSLEKYYRVRKAKEIIFNDR